MAGSGVRKFELKVSRVAGISFVLWESVCVCVWGGENGAESLHLATMFQSIIKCDGCSSL